MDHTYFQERLSAYLDRELPPEELKTVEEHIAVCGECARRLAELKKLDEFIGRSSDLDEAAYWEKSAAKIEANLPVAQTLVTDIRTKRTGLYTGLWWKLPAVAASVLIVGYIGLHETEIIQDDVMIPPRKQIKAESKQEAPVETIKTTEAIEPALMDIESRASDSVNGAVPVEPKTETVTAEEVIVEPTANEVATPITSPLVPALTEAAPETPQRSKAAPVTAGGRMDSFGDQERAESTLPVVESDYRRSHLDSGLLQTDSRSKEKSRISTVLADREPPIETGGETEEALTVPPPPPPKTPSTEVSGKERQRIQKMMDGSRSSFNGGSVGKTAVSVQAASEPLADWRRTRDSLTVVLDSLRTISDEGKGIRMLAPGKSKERDQSATTLWSPSSLKNNRARVEADLLDVWYDICRVSEDGDEIDRGVEYLRGVAENRKSKLRDKARHYLELLDR